MVNIKLRLEKQKLRLQEMLSIEDISNIDKTNLIKRMKKVEDRLKYFLLGIKEQESKKNIMLNRLRKEVDVYKENYKLIWEKLEEVDRKKKKHCFCGGDELFRPICSKCQNWRTQIISGLLREWILTNNKKKDFKDFFFFFSDTFDKDLKRVGYDIDNIKSYAVVGEEEQ